MHIVIVLPPQGADRSPFRQRLEPGHVPLIDHQGPGVRAGNPKGRSSRSSHGIVIIAICALLVSSAVLVIFDSVPKEPLKTTETNSGAHIGDLVFTYDTSVYQTEWPIEWWVKNSFEVKNNGSGNLTVDFNATLLETGVETSPFPQPFCLYLSPGENQTVRYMLDMPWSGLTDADLLVAQDFARTLRFVFWIRGNTSDSRTITMNHVIHVVPRTWLEANPNAEISGHVYAPAGKPLEGVTLQLLGSNLDYSSLTNQTGYYRIQFRAHRTLMTNETLPYGLVVKESGYEAFMRSFSPLSGDSIVQDIHLAKVTETANLTLANRTETGMTIYRGAVSADERYVVFGQGHCELNLTENEIRNRSSVMLFDAWTGKILWRHYAGGEVWGADISADGRYVVATVIQPAPISYAVLLDRNGTEVWNTTSMGDMGSREIRISHDSRHIAWGVGNGSLYMLNLTDMEVLWTTFLEGQIRQILFSKDDSTVYAGSGDGYLYAVNTTTGAIEWRTNIEAWPYSTGGMTLSKDGSLIATASKIGDISLINTTTHEKLWSFDTSGGGHYADISPNMDYVLAGSGGPFGTVLLDVNGSVRWFERGSGNGRMFSDGAHIALGQDWGLDIINPNGTVLSSYTEDFSWTGRPVTTSFVYVFKNQTRIIVGHGSGAAFFWNVSFGTVPWANDSIAPVTTDDYNGSWRPSDFRINLTATDGNSGVAATYYMVNDGPRMNVSVDGQPLIHTEGANNKLECWSVDRAGNEEWPHHVLAGIKLDVTDPVARAGADQTVLAGTVVELNGSASFDNFGIMNYTWTFVYGGETKMLYGKTVVFQFDSPGTYFITLRVSDGSGRSSTDMMNVTVEVAIPEFPAYMLGPTVMFVALALAFLTHAQRRGDVLQGIIKQVVREGGLEDLKKSK